MTKRLPEIFEEMRDALLGRNPDHQWGQTAGDAYQATMTSVKNIGGDTLEKTAATLNEALPYIERAGYDVVEIEVGVGLSPKFVAHLKLREQIELEEQTGLLDETENKKLIHTILESLFRAINVRKRLRFKKYEFTHAELELSILPTVSLKFSPVETIAADSITGSSVKIDDTAE